MRAHGRHPYPPTPAARCGANRKANLPFPPVSLPLSHALAARGYDSPTPVQAAVLAPEAAGRDLVVTAQTGSGKTVAFGLALSDTLLGGAERLPPEGPLALAVAPTRELALQVQRELAWLYAEAGAVVISCVGGMDPRAERRALERGAHIIVGTPGRLRDHIERRALDLSRLRAVVLDEADEMLDLGFREDLEFILEATPVERRTLLFSATLPKPIVTLAARFQRDALRIQASGAARSHADIAYRVVRAAENERVHAIVNILREADSPTAIIFCNTREAARHLSATLGERGFAAATLSGELSQNERNHALQALRDHRARVCVATDVAARGLDLPNLDLVIHADLPTDPAILQHRSGRTGRAGRKGVAILLATPTSLRRAERLLERAGLNATWSGPPTAEAIRELDRQRLLVDPILTAAPGEDDLALGRQLLQAASPDRIAAALVHAYRSRLPEPEDVTDPGTERGRPARREPRDRPTASRSGADRNETGGENRDETGSGIWFRLDVGRKKNADPKWLLPMLCKRGNINKRNVGAIRIFDRESKVEIAAGVAESFAAAVAVPGPKGDNIAIERTSAPGGPAIHREGPAATVRTGRGDPRRQRDRT